jgi:hypothetical protein
LSAQEIEQHLEQQAQSGQSIVDYCRHHHLKASNFYNWKSKYKHPNTPQSASNWIELSRMAPKPSTPHPPVSTTPTSAACVNIQLNLPGGMVLSISTPQGR